MCIVLTVFCIEISFTNCNSSFEDIPNTVQNFKTPYKIVQEICRGSRTFGTLCIWTMWNIHVLTRSAPSVSPMVPSEVTLNFDDLVLFGPDFKTSSFQLDKNNNDIVCCIFTISQDKGLLHIIQMKGRNLESKYIDFLIKMSLTAGLTNPSLINEKMVLRIRRRSTGSSLPGIQHRRIFNT